MTLRSSFTIYWMSIALLSSTPVSAESLRDMHREVKVSEAIARKTALSRVPPHSIVQSVGLERESGKLLWSYDIKTPSKDITEVQIDAVTGEVAGVLRESTKDEAAEKAADTH